MLKLAWLNLVHERTRLIISVSGVALAVLLILVMNGIFAGSEEVVVRYIRSQPAPLWLMQAGVENIHMSSSILPADAVERAAQVPGVQRAVGVLYANAAIAIDDTLIPSYLFGAESGVELGGPWSLTQGTADLALNEVVIDEALARRYNLTLGDSISVAGYDLRVAGLMQGTFGIAVNIVFVNKTALALATGVSPQSASYILIQPDPTADVQEVAEALRNAVPEANVMSQTDFIAEEQALVRQMGTDIILAMTTVAYIIGMLVIGLTVYTATLERSHEYGILKAIGVSNRQLLGVVAAQALSAAGLGYVTGIALAYSTAALVIRLLPEILILIEPTLWLREIPVLLTIVILAAFSPVGRILRLDPLVVFRT